MTLAALYTETDEKKVVLIDESERLRKSALDVSSDIEWRIPFRQTLKRKSEAKSKASPSSALRYSLRLGMFTIHFATECIVVEMQRTMAGSRTEYVRQFAKEEGTEIAHEIEEALGARIGKIQDAYLNYHNLYPSLGFLPDRDRELWKPLFALCQVFAPDRIRPTLSGLRLTLRL